MSDTYANWGVGESFATADAVTGQYCDYPQKQWSESYGTSLPAIIAEKIIYRKESYNPAYSEIICKMGTNPLPPEGSVILSKETDPVTGMVTMICGMMRTGARQGETADAPQYASIVDGVPDAGLFGDKLIAERAAQNQNNAAGALASLGISTVAQVVPSNPLAGAQAVGLEAAKITAMAPNLTATRSFVGGGDIDIVNDEATWGWLWVVIVIVLVLVGLGFKAWHDGFDWRRLLFWKGSPGQASGE